MAFFAASCVSGAIFLRRWARFVACTRLVPEAFETSITWSSSFQVPVPSILWGWLFMGEKLKSRC